MVLHSTLTFCLLHLLVFLHICSWEENYFVYTKNTIIRLSDEGQFFRGNPIIDNGLCSFSFINFAHDRQKMSLSI